MVTSKKKAATKRLIFWKKSEHDLVAAELARMLIQNPRLHVGTALDTAQRKVLSAERWRPIKAPSSSKETVELAYKKIEEFHNSNKEQQESNGTHNGQILEQAFPPDEPVDKPENADQFVLGSDTGMAIALLIDIISDSIAEKITGQLLNSLSGLFASAPIPTPSTPQVGIMLNKIRAQRAARLPTVVVAGLKGSQKTEIEKAFNDKLNIKFWNTDNNPHHLKDMCRSANRVFAMTDFIAHSHEQSIRAVAPEKFVRVSGGIDKLKSELLNWTSS